MVVGVAVGHVARVAEHGDPIFRAPTVHAAVRDVAEGEVALGGMPDGPFGEGEALAQSLQGKVFGNDVKKARIADFDAQRLDAPMVGMRQNTRIMKATLRRQDS